MVIFMQKEVYEIVEIYMDDSENEVVQWVLKNKKREQVLQQKNFQKPNIYIWQFGTMTLYMES